MAWDRLPLDWSTPDKCGIAVADLDEMRAAIQERVDYLKAVVVDDAFTNGFIHANRWIAAVYAGGTLPVEGGGVLTLALPDANLISDASSYVKSNAWRFAGDFDCSVDWAFAPASELVSIRMQFRNETITRDVSMGLYRTGGVNYYNANSSSGGGGITATADVNGTFRILRSGNTIQCYASGVLKLNVTDEAFGGIVMRVDLGLQIGAAKSAGWGGASCTFDNFTRNSGVVGWRKKVTEAGYLSDISLTDVLPSDVVWPVAAINNYRLAIEDMLPYFFDDAAGTTRWAKAACLTAAIGQVNWTDELIAYQLHAKRKHLNEPKQVCDKLIFLPDDTDAVDGFVNPGWVYEA